MADAEHSGERRTAFPEKRYVTVLFTDIYSWTSIAEEAEKENEEPGEILAQVNTVTDAVIAKHGGEVVQREGDSTMALFGHPTPQEDQVRRATTAAIELHKSVARLRPGPFQLNVSMHTGIHAGLVSVEPGDPVHGAYKLPGDTVNKTKRLAQEASRDEIIVSASTLRGPLEFFVTRRLPKPLTLPGISAPTEAYLVLGLSGATTRLEASARRGLTPFVGRESELRRLQRCSDAVLNGHLQLVRILGEGGIGKSRLAHQFLGSVGDGCDVHRGYCESYGSAAPLQPFLQMLRRYFDIGSEASVTRTIEHGIRAIDERLLVHLPEFLRMLSLDPDGGTGQVPTGSDPVGALSALFLALASRRPLALFIDDWHEADDLTRQTVSSVARVAREKPVMVLTASRRLDASDPVEEGTVIRLDPFSPTESRRTVDYRLNDTLRPEIADAIHHHTGGNVLFLEEMCEELRHSRSTPDATPSDAKAVVQNVPATLKGLIGARVADLPAALLDVAQCAAVIGEVVPPSLLSCVSADTDRDGLFDQLRDRGIFKAGRTDTQLCFRHGMTRAVVYNTIAVSRRRELHRAIATAVRTRGGTGDESVETLAHHYFEGAEYVAAAAYGERAGNRAMATASLDRARHHYGHALKALRRQAQSDDVRRRWMSISRRWARACAYNPEPHQLTTLQRTADLARQLGDSRSEARADYWRGWIHYALGEQDSAISLYRGALEKGDEELAVLLMAALGQSYAAKCDYVKAVDCFADAFDGVPLIRSAAAAGLAYAKCCHAMVLGDQGSFDLAHRSVKEALEDIQGADPAIDGAGIGARTACRDFPVAGRLGPSARRISEGAGDGGTSQCALRLRDEQRNRWLRALDARTLPGGVG